MNVIILPLARIQAIRIANYIYENWGQKSAEKFGKQYVKCRKILSGNPTIGALEHLLIHRPEKYRYIMINNKNKIIYRIQDNNIYIVDIWDTRMNPETLIGRVGK